MPIGNYRGEPFPKCKHCGEWIEHLPGKPWTHYFTKVEQCNLANTSATPGEVRRGIHTIVINVPR